MGICTRCGYLSTDPINPGDPTTEHVCAPEKVNFMKGMAKLLYDLVVYADPASTAGQKSSALTRIQQKRTWIEANASWLQEWLN